MARPPAPVTEQRVQRGGARPGLGVPVADEQERRDRRQLPARVEHDDVVGLDEAEHRAAEQDQQAGQPAEVACVGSEVPGGVDEDRDADRRDDQRHRCRKPVQTQFDAQPEAVHPAEAFGHRRTTSHSPELRRNPSSGGHHRDRADQKSAATEPAAHRDQPDADQRERGEKDNHLSADR